MRLHPGHNAQCRNESGQKHAGHDGSGVGRRDGGRGKGKKRFRSGCEEQQSALWGSARYAYLFQSRVIMITLRIINQAPDGSRRLSDFATWTSCTHLLARFHRRATSHFFLHLLSSSSHLVFLPHLLSSSTLASLKLFCSSSVRSRSSSHHQSVLVSHHATTGSPLTPRKL